jgi:hypothetical protein
VRRLGVALVAITAWGALGSATASAQQVDPAVDDLRDNDVSFEEGALSSSELDELDATVAELQGRDGYFKVVVLAEPIEDLDDGRDFADRVREGLGGLGRVMVWTPNEVALSSNLDTPEEIDNAEQAAADRINSGGSLASATGSAAAALGADAGGVAADPSGSGVPWLLLLLVIGISLLLLWVMWRSARRQRERATALSAEEMGAAETKVRSAVDKVANDLLELADKTDLPDAPAESRAAFSQGAQLFTETQKLLEEADTRPELEAAYRHVIRASWHMGTTRALLAGQPTPPEPEPEELFPELVVVAVPAGTSPDQVPGGIGAPRPEPQYRQPDMSPWITAAAMAAMAMLSRRGMAQPRTRPPMNDDAFGQWAGGLPPSPSRSRSSGGIFGGMFGGGRGGGRVVMPSGRSRGRGMGRR